jgi:hypothetical protein
MLKIFINKTHSPTLKVIFLKIIKIMKIITIIFNYVLGRDFLGFVTSIEQQKYKSKFKGIVINLDLNCQFNHLQDT